MRTIGVDLAAEPRATAVAAIEWEPAGARIAALSLGADDAQVLQAVIDADRAAVDCPLGWPDLFVDFVVAHRDGHVAAPAGIPGLAWRRTLSRRRTDLECERLTGVRPLSVAADRIAAVAMRGAGLLGALAASGVPVDRSGCGRLVETYPAAALRLWGLPHQGYKGARNAGALGQLAEALLRATPWLDPGGHEPLLRRCDDALDAVVCALVGRAAALGAVAGPDGPEDTASAQREGWITLPTGMLDALVSGATDRGNQARPAL